MTLVSNAVLRQVADLLERGQHGRACRLYARHSGHSPRILRDPVARQKWIEGVRAMRDRPKR